MTGKERLLVVVTGATGGIGQAICGALARKGMDILGQYRNRAAEAERLRKEVEALGVRCTTVLADLEKSSGIDAVTDAVDKLTRSDGVVLRGLVNNAAVLLGPGFDEAEEGEYDRYMAVNLRAPFFLTQRLSRRMPRGGSIVNISSAGAHFSSPGDIVYALTKSALESMAFHAAEALAENGIRINAVVPGFTDNGHPLFTAPEAREYMGTYAAMGGVSDPSVVAEAVAFLLSDRSSRTTGSTLDVSGGSTLGARARTPTISLRASH